MSNIDSSKSLASRCDFLNQITQAFGISSVSHIFCVVLFEIKRKSQTLKVLDILRFRAHLQFRLYSVPRQHGRRTTSIYILGHCHKKPTSGNTTKNVLVTFCHLVKKTFVVSRTILGSTNCQICHHITLLSRYEQLLIT